MLTSQKVRACAALSVAGSTCWVLPPSGIVHCFWLHIASLSLPMCWQRGVPPLSCICGTWLGNNLSVACTLAVGATLPVTSRHSTH